MEVRISGSVFASLFIDLANSRGDIEGFLFGGISSRTKRTVSDSQDVSVKREKIFAVHDLLVCRGLFSFYDGVGSIHPEKLTSILKTRKQNVLGWFKFRRNTRLVMSMREKALHRNIMKELNIENPQDFFFSIFTSNFDPNMATHQYKYTSRFCARDSRIFKGIATSIVNLGNTSQSEYKHHIEPTRSISKLYQNTIGSFRDEFLDNLGQLQQVKHARSMYSNMLGKLKTVSENVKSSERELLAVSEEVQSLKEELENEIKKKRNKGQQNLIEFNEEEQDLIMFDEVPKKENNTKKVTVIMKDINAVRMNNVHHSSSNYLHIDDHYASSSQEPQEHYDSDHVISQSQLSPSY